MSDTSFPRPLQGLCSSLAKAYGLTMWRSGRMGEPLESYPPLPALCSLVRGSAPGHGRCEGCYAGALIEMETSGLPWLSRTCHAGLGLLVIAFPEGEGCDEWLVLGRQPVVRFARRKIDRLGAELGMGPDGLRAAMAAVTPIGQGRWTRLQSQLDVHLKWNTELQRVRSEATALRMDLATLAQVGVRLGNVMPAGKFLEELLQMATELVRARAGLVLLADSSSGELRPSVAQGSLEDVELLRSAHACVSGASVAFASGEPLMRTAQDFGASLSPMDGALLPSCLFWVPMKSAGDVVGVLCMSSQEPRSNRESMLYFTLLQLLATYGAVAVKSEMMRRDLIQKEQLATGLLDATIRAQEEERERICLEVHDGVAQTLVAALRHLEVAGVQLTAGSNAAAGPVDKSTGLLRQSIREVREVLGSLRPSTLDTLGLVRTLQEELLLLERETGWKTELKAPNLRLSKEVETALYRILHEAIVNARKHSDTRRLSVRLTVSKQELVAVVRDWGKGFESSEMPQRIGSGQSIGLLSMKKRAELLGGRCDVTSHPGAGTAVRVQLPILERSQGSGTDYSAVGR